MSTAVLEWQSDLQLWTFCCCMSNECTCGSLIYQWLMTCYSGLHVGYVQWTMTDSRVVAVSQQTGLTESDAAKLLRGGWSIFLTYNFFSPKAYCLSPSCHYCHFTFAMQTLAAAFTKQWYFCAYTQRDWKYHVLMLQGVLKLSISCLWLCCWFMHLFLVMLSLSYIQQWVICNFIACSLCDDGQ